MSKQLLPLYILPMVYFPLSLLMLAGIRKILVITTPNDRRLYRALLGDGSQWGLSISYRIQLTPGGLAQAFLVGEKFIAGDPVALVLGDNVLYGHGLPAILRQAARLKTGAHIFGYEVNDPRRYGVIGFGPEKRVVSLREKPRRTRSRHAIVGLYFVDAEAVALTKTLKPSRRGELEVTDLLRRYLKKRTLRAEVLGRGIAWLDTGTPDSLLDAANYIATVRKRQRFLIGSPDEIAWRQHWITRRQLQHMAAELKGSDYGLYLRQLLRR